MYTDEAKVVEVLLNYLDNDVKNVGLGSTKTLLNRFFIIVQIK